MTRQPGCGLWWPGGPTRRSPTTYPAGTGCVSPASSRPLAPSAYAQDIKTLAQQELGRLLRGTPAQQDLLGLLTAARGGLSGPDLAALTGESLWEIEDVLHGVSGRTFTRRVSTWQPGDGPEVYLLGHEELQATAHGILRRSAAGRLPGSPARLGGGIPGPGAGPAVPRNTCCPATSRC